MESTSQKPRPLEYAMVSTARTAAINSTGRKIRPKSRTRRTQSRTALAKLHATPSSQSASRNPRYDRGGAYPLARRRRLLSKSYTPARSASFSTLITGPSSGNTHGHPLVAMSGSVAAQKTAPAMRGTGVIGRPASMSFVGRLRIDVSLGGKYQNRVEELRSIGQ